MFNFKIIHKSKKSKARIGIMHTSHGDVETPAFVAVGTNAVIKTLDSREITDTKTQIIIANTYHLHLKPGEKIIQANGGLHKFMNHKGPIMTDSGGFQVFSLGFGRDLRVGKVLKYFPGDKSDVIDTNSMPINIKITEEGVHFRSPYEDKDVFIGPKESMDIQKKLGADIIFTFDECTAPLSNSSYIRRALDRTHKWAKICRQHVAGNQALFGIVQGSSIKEMRQESAKYISGLGFEGYGIGGDLGVSKETIKKILSWVTPTLEENKPRHLLGIGYLQDLEDVVKEGIDLFDCIVPTHYARRGIAFTSTGRFDLRKRGFLTDFEPLDKKCECFVCQDYKRSYISHLFRAKELTAFKLVSYHNLFYFNTYVEKIRERIKEGKI